MDNMKLAVDKTENDIQILEGLIPIEHDAGRKIKRSQMCKMSNTYLYHNTGTMVEQLKMLRAHLADQKRQLPQ